MEFFEKRGHKIIKPAALVLPDDPTTLFTSSGMQPLVRYLAGEPHPLGKRLANSQPSIRVSDIEEVGDNRHDTFFEMLGNWSLGDPAKPDGIGAGYFKAEQLAWFFEFLTKELGLDKNRFWVSVFSGDKKTNVPKDEDSLAIWNKLGIPEEKICFYGVEKNWWSRSGPPEQMPAGEIGGPDSEVFYEFENVQHDAKFGEYCHPNCDCGRFLEIGNSVFIQYQKEADGTLKELPQKNVDFGGGLERLAAACANAPDIFMTDLFSPIIKKIEALSKLEYGDKTDDFYINDGKQCWVDVRKSMRIVADHLKAATMIARDGVLPSNKGQGYILRRLLRRAIVFSRKLGIDSIEGFFPEMVSQVGKIYKDVIPELEQREKETNEAFLQEGEKFSLALSQGLKEIKKMEKINIEEAFYLYESFGLPWEIIQEQAKEKGVALNFSDFELQLKKHQDLSRASAKGMFRGGLADQSEQVAKLHTATHLLHQALRIILGEHVKQEGSNITAERLRFDFHHFQKMTGEQIAAVEQLVNQKIKENLAVSFEIMDKEKAIELGAKAFFKEKYEDRVKVYSISSFSREICGGPHAKTTGELGQFKIIKEEAVGQGIRRIKAILI